jgi:excisionase family DNA binding protein
VPEKVPAGHLLTKKEVAERLGVSERTIHRRIRDGSIPAVRLGSGRMSPVRIDADELDAWVYGEERP